MNSNGLLRAGCHQISSIICGILAIISVKTQAQIYSINALAYVDANLVAGSNLVANPLNALDNSVSNLFRGVPDGSFLVFGPNGPTNSYSAATGWTDPRMIFVMPKGAALWVPSATRISFVGEVWRSTLVGPMAHYQAGNYLLSVIPGSGTIWCDNFTGPCPPAAPPDGTTMLKWNPQTQSFADLYSYYDGTGWLPGAPVLGPAESALFDVPTPFYVPAAPIAASSIPRVRTSPEWRRDSGEFSLRFSASNSMSYTLLRSSNLTARVWEVVHQQTANPTGGVALVTAGAGTNRAGFYQIFPAFDLGYASIFGGSRTGTEFRFQLYAPVAATYTVERATSLPATTWQIVGTIPAGPTNVVTVVDANATATRGYYRVRY